MPKEDAFFQLKQPDLQKVKAFYQEMHFMTLLKELQLPEKSSEELNLDFGVDTSESSYTLINNETDLMALLEELKDAKVLCIDTETTGVDPMQAKLVGIGITDNVARGWYIPLNGKIDRKRIFQLMGPFLADPKRAFFGHNIKYDLHILENAGISICRVDFDTMIA